LIKLTEVSDLTSVKSQHSGEVPNKIWFVYPVVKFGSSEGGTLNKSG
jgi:hypothetical protein